MHMRGTPQTMASLTHYDDVVADILAALTRLVDAAGRAGIARDRLVIDPGLGFAKTAAQSIAVLRRLEVFATLGLPILAGVSRKSFIGTLGGEADPQRRAPGSIAAALFAVERGASILRVHDVAQTVQALRVWTALVDSGKEDQGRGPWTPLRTSP
jgi:dihydropteroate synthase